jgi:hypothetical protein
MLLLQATGQSFNIMTLGGIAAAVGLIIDDVIVMVEHIARRAGALHRTYDDIPLGKEAVLPAGKESGSGFGCIPPCGDAITTLQGCPFARPMGISFRSIEWPR